MGEGEPSEEQKESWSWWRQKGIRDPDKSLILQIIN